MRFCDNLSFFGWTLKDLDLKGYESSAAILFIPFLTNQGLNYS